MHFMPTVLQEGKFSKANDTVCAEDVENYIFLHVPKTAGTSLASLIAAHLGDQALWQAGPDDQFSYRKYLSRAKCIMGHTPLFLKDVVGRDRKVFATFREPRSRVASFVNHIVNDPSHPSNFFVQSGNSFDLELLLHRPFSFEIRNLQTRMIGVRPPDYLVNAAARGSYRAFRECMTLWYETPLTDAHLEQAVAALADMKIGVHELFPHALAHTFAPLTGGAWSNAPHLRAPNFQMELTQDVLEMIDRENEYDAALYHVARGMALEGAARQLAQCQEFLPLPGAPYTFSGLHDPENLHGENLRWTNGRAQITLKLPTAPGARKIAVRAHRLESTPANIVIRVNGVEAPLATTDTHLRWNVSGLPASEAIHIEVVSETKRHFPDVRELGVPLASIRVETAPTAG